MPEPGENGLRILQYHAISEDDSRVPDAWRVKERAFVQQLERLVLLGIPVVPLASVSRQESTSQLRVAITFDDGHWSQLRAASILKEYQLPATFFLVPRFLDAAQAKSRSGETRSYLNWDEAKRLLAAGFEVGGHSKSHVDLTELSPEHARLEIGGCFERLRDVLGCAPRTFSYPFGRYNEAVRVEVARAGFSLGCTSRFGEAGHQRSPLLLNRIEVRPPDDLNVFGRKVKGHYDWYGTYQDLFWYRRPVTRSAMES